MGEETPGVSFSTQANIGRQGQRARKGSAGKSSVLWYCFLIQIIENISISDESWTGKRHYDEESHA